MSVTTKTGDKGQTRLFTGQSIAKDDLRVETYGTIDQLTATIGMARAFAQNARVKELLFQLQKQLGILMATLRAQRPGWRSGVHGRSPTAARWRTSTCVTSTASRTISLS